MTFVIQRVCRENDTFPELDKEFGLEGKKVCVANRDFKMYNYLWQGETDEETVAAFLKVAPSLRYQHKYQVNLRVARK